MEIYALRGHKVKCVTLTAGYKHDQEIAKRNLLLNEIYTVDHTDVHNYSTDVYLEEIPGVAFNSVFFDDVNPQSLKDSKDHPDYKRYNYETEEY